MVSPIILALDTDDLDVAINWVEATRDSVDVYKVGLEFFLKFGRTGLEKIKKDFNPEIFLDLKLHDIPNTVGAATKAVAGSSPKFLTIHASGGAAMVQAAVSAGPEIAITAVTILTSLSEDDLNQIGFKSGTEERAVQLAKLATDNGAKAIVCSPHEISAIRSSIPDSVEIITPGIRPISGAVSDDQKRTMDPKSAITSGANYLVIGRPITNLWSEGVDAMRKRAAEIRSEI